MKTRALLLLLALPATAHANPIDAFGFGARGPAMGGAQTAATQDGGANYYNPAALVTGDDIKIDLGYQLAAPTLTLNGGDVHADASRGLAVGLSAPGHFAGVKIAMGAGVFLPDERITRVRTEPAQRPRFVLYDNRPQRIFLGANLAIQLTPKLSIGGGIAYMSKTSGTVTLQGRVGFPNYDDSNLALGIDVDLKTIRYPQAGLLWHATPYFDVGVAYRGSFTLHLDQTFIVSGDVGPAMGDPVIKDGYFKLRSLALDLFQPAQIAAGFSLRFTRDVTIAGDLTWQHWDAYENPAAHIDLMLDLKDFQHLVNIPAAPPIPGAYFHDIVVPRIGVEVYAGHTRHSTWYARGGYAYEPSPAPEQRGESNLIDNDKHTISLGLGAQFRRLTEIVPKPFDVDLYGAATILEDRAHRKLSPIDPVGDYVSRGYVLEIGIATRWRF